MGKDYFVSSSLTQTHPKQHTDVCIAPYCAFSCSSSPIYLLILTNLVSNTVSECYLHRLQNTSVIHESLWRRVYSSVATFSIGYFF